MMTSMYTTALCRSNHEFEWFKHRKSSCIWHTLHRHWNVWNIFLSRYTKDKHKLASSAKGGIIIIYINSYNTKLCMQGNKSNRYTKISFSFVHVVAFTRVVRKLGKQHLNNIDTHTHTHHAVRECLIVTLIAFVKQWLIDWWCIATSCVRIDISYYRYQPFTAFDRSVFKCIYKKRAWCDGNHKCTCVALNIIHAQRLL